YVNIDDIRNKTDQELGWHMEDDFAANIEQDVVRKGFILNNESTQCMVNGMIHNILGSKRPMYENGQIFGVMGYFIDIDEELSLLDNIYNERRLDAVTGLMNVNALGEASKSYAHNYATNQTNYAQIVLRNENHHRIVKDYGEEFGNKLLKEMGNVILEVTDGKCAVGKCLGADFGAVTNYTKQPEFDQLIQELVTKLENIRKIDGKDITVKIRIAYKFRNEEGITDENIYTSVLQELM
ncbi:MAG: GGDEF domain-containing protein, partial [Lachnospiraceae bacterium]|nr:GGDEF domain-containing protein [Lachnospiraceae bacterium]